MVEGDYVWEVFQHYLYMAKANNYKPSPPMIATALTVADLIHTLSLALTERIDHERQEESNERNER